MSVGQYVSEAAGDSFSYARRFQELAVQIAEAWAKRRYPKHFVSKLTDAEGEQLETQHWLAVAFDSGYISRDDTRRLGELCLEVGCMLGEMIVKADRFCRPDDNQLREEPPAYGAQTDPLLLITDLLTY
jgi:hypothetical protein